MNVDWQIYYEAAKRCHQLADDLRKADKPVHDAVKGTCVGMAGDATGCAEWGKTYDEAARKTLQASASLANALTNYGAVLYAQGYNWGIANKSKPAPHKPNTSQVGEYTVNIPSSVHDNGLGFAHSGGVKAFFDKLVAQVIEKFHKLPNGDAAKLKTAHETWNTFASHETVTGAAAQISAISGLFDGIDDATNRQHIQDHFTTLKTGADSLATAALNVSAPVGKYHDATLSFGQDTAHKINWLEAGVAAAAVAGIALAVFTVGMSVEVSGEAIAGAVTATIGAIEESFSASALAEIFGYTALVAATAVTIKAFDAFPGDLEKVAANLAAIIAMKVLIDGGEHTQPSDQPDFRHGEYTQDEIEEFINGHTGDGNPTMDRPTPAQVHDALEHGTPEPMGDGRTPEQAEQFVYKGIKVVVNYELPWKSTAWKL
ncbi:hypothetical protein J2W56_003261 [Nocardia kruczakiae]|uniref:HNH/ENDO VII superfamily nuclease n=1 Tax=Nocardia kruczakiae TaxID=261477 RepID=A0ABU1XG32_9NOCA|nr:hypothetical protein [Nocardia kruczakiae]MDR7169520.1 hypothetical protein [Nocardia kruczakiae]